MYINENTLAKTKINSNGIGTIYDPTYVNVLPSTTKARCFSGIRLDEEWSKNGNVFDFVFFNKGTNDNNPESLLLLMPLSALKSRKCLH